MEGESSVSEVKLYKIGGVVRDELLGLKSKDIDYAVEAPSFEAIKDYIINERGGKVHVEKPEFYTLRGKIPELGDVDFVWCRIEGPYSDGRRPDWVKPGTLLDDQRRRDFTMNSIAVAEDGTVHDPFDGQTHIKHRLIAPVGVAKERFAEDSLRMIRAVRFSITKRFVISPEIENCFDDPELLALLKNVSIERVREELLKMFDVATLRTMHLFTEVYPALGATIFDTQKLYLKPTLRE